VAVVTGASQGIGQATAIRLARDFSALALVARNRDNLERTAALVRERGAEALIIDADLSEPQSAPAVVDKTLSAFGRIDALLNIAGAVPQIDLFEMSDAQWEAGLALKLHGARRLTLAAWPALQASKGSVVLDVGLPGRREVSRGSRYCPLRRPGGDCRAHGVPGVPRREMADRFCCREWTAAR
jgi:3-oxoacyl-[acyl-carrier protein] reductase